VSTKPGQLQGLVPGRGPGPGDVELALFDLDAVERAAGGEVRDRGQALVQQGGDVALRMDFPA
jgi:hypothetical protein